MKRVPNAVWWQKANLQRIIRGTGITFVDPLNTYIDPQTPLGGQGTVVHPSTFIRGETVTGNNCVLGPLVIITDCKIGNDTHITDGAKLKRCIVGDRVRIPHECYLADAVMGDDTNIGHGTGTSNWDGLKKQKTTIGKRCFVGTFVDFISPVTIGDECFITSRTRVSAKGPIPQHSFVFEEIHNGRAKTVWKENCSFKSPHHWLWLWTKKPVDPEVMKKWFNALKLYLGDYGEWLQTPHPNLDNKEPGEFFRDYGEGGLETLLRITGAER